MKHYLDLKWNRPFNFVCAGSGAPVVQNFLTTGGLFNGIYAVYVGVAVGVADGADVHLFDTSTFTFPSLFG